MNQPVVKKIGRYSFMLVEEFEADSIIVPAGFVTDGASVPRAFWSLFNPCGELFEAAIVHDYQYAKKIISKQDADKRFLNIAKAYGAKRARWAYWAVKYFGQWG